MSLNESNSSQKVLNSDGLKHLLQKLKTDHMDKKASNSDLGHVKIGPINTPTAVNGEGIAAPSYHTHPAQTEITGNAGTASKLKNAVNIALAGAVTGNADFDGSKNITINTTMNKNSQAITGKTSLSGLEPGDYVESNGNKYTDSPSGSNSTNDFVISVIGSGNDRTQIFTDLATGKVYIRVIENGTPSDWKEVLTLSNGNIDANASSADKLKTPRTISVSGDAEGSTSFDGSKNVDIDLTLSDTGVDADTYGVNSQSNFNTTREIVIPSYTVDAAGRITVSSDQTIKIPESSGSSSTGGSINPVTIGLSGDVTGSKLFDGTTNITIDTTLKDSGATAGTYGQNSNLTIGNGSSLKVPKITIDSKGRVTSLSDTTVSIPSDAFDKVKTTTATSGVIYISGKSTSNDNTGAELINPNLYYDVTNNTFHAGKIAATIEGVSNEATKLSTARDIALAGDVTGSTSFDGSKNVSIATTLKNSGVTAGTYGNTSNVALTSSTSVIIPKITVDAKGIVTSASTTTATISADSLNKVKSSPTTTGKIYLSGKTDSTESTSTDVHSSGLYYDTETKTLVAPNISGKATSASTADRLVTAVNIGLSGDATGTASFDGSKSISIATVLASTGVTAGTYGLGSALSLSDDVTFNVPQFTVDTKGRITAAKHSTVTLPASVLNRVKTTTAKSGLIYISGKATSDDNTGQEFISPNLYYDVTNNTFHAGKIAATIEGVSNEATKLATARAIGLNGDVTGASDFDGSVDISIKATLSDTGVTAGTYGNTTTVNLDAGSNFQVPSIAIDSKGRVTSAKNVSVKLAEEVLTKVKASPAENGYIYLTGKATSKESTGTDILSPNLYYDVVNNTFHAGKIAATIEGVSDKTNRLSTARNIALSGDVTGSTSFDGSQDVSIAATLKNSGATAGTYGNSTNVSLGAGTSINIPKITIDAKGIVTSASTTTATISADSLNKVKSSPVTTGKIYLSGKTESTESTSTDAHNSGLYYDTETKTLVAPNISGKATNAASADKLTTAVNIGLSGDATGTASFDGSKSVSIATTLANSGVTADTYGANTQANTDSTRQLKIPKFVIDSKGRVTSASDQSITLPNTASTAGKLAKAMKLTATGDATGSVSFDGSQDVSLALTLANSGVTAGKYGSALSTTLGTDNTINIPYFTVDAKGRVTSAKNSPLTIPDNAFNTVKTDIADSGYIFISGKNELVAGNGTEVINSDLYYDVTNKILHAGKIAGTIEGVSDSANRLAKAVNINLVGAVKGSQAFDGSTSINITTTIETITNEEIDLMMES